jgi:hypothetical protein
VSFGRFVVKPSRFPAFPMKPCRVIGFDADDTLWHNETIFEHVHERYRALLARYHDAATVDRTLFATEIRNLELYGYGVKGFMLSAIETAIQLTDGRISAGEISTLLQLGRDMLEHPVELLDGVADTLAALAGSSSPRAISATRSANWPSPASAHTFITSRSYPKKMRRLTPPSCASMPSPRTSS